MSILNTGDILAQEGFRVAPNRKARILEAAKLFNEGAAHRSNHAMYRLREAFSTSDFPVLLGAAFEVEAIQAQRQVPNEFEPFALPRRVSDFRRKRLIDLFGSTYFEDVPEGGEYKGDDLAETEIEYKVGKTGRVYGLTWELMLSGDFSDLSDFPGLLGQGAARTENRKVYEVLVGAGGLSTDFFGTVDTKALTFDNVKAAKQSLVTKTDHRGDLVDLSTLVLVVPPSLEEQANSIVAVQQVKNTTTSGSRTTETIGTNPLASLKVQVSREFAALNGSANAATSWALLPGKDTTNPAVIKANLLGHETVDIRVKRDQGDRVGGGAIDANEGSFNDDTIWFRGRHVIGAAKGFTSAVYASDGTVA